MPASQKIITKLRERRQIEADLRKMLTAGSELELRRQAQQVASLGPQVIPAIVGSLDRADAQMLAALGTVATLLKRDEVTAALRQAVLQPGRTDRGRMGAMTILERFLGQPPDDALVASLRNPAGMAVASLQEVLSQAEHNPTLLLQYVEQLDRQEPDVVLAVIGSLREVGAPSLVPRQTAPTSAGPEPRAVEPLRMMAQDVREEIATAALQVLGGIRLPEAARALQTLIPITTPALRPLAERLLRKLQFSRVEVNPLPAPEPDWRALVSPLNGLGQQSIWFIQENRWTAQAQFLNILLSDRAGAVETVGHPHVPARMLPPRRRLGHLHDIAAPDGSGATLMLEAAFDLGRRLVVEALAYNRETQIPVAGPLRLLNPWLWGYAGADSLPPRVLPELSAADEILATVSDRLLDHPAFSAWTVVHSRAIFQAAEEAMQHPGWELDIWVRRLASELFGEPGVSRVLSRRLAAMSEWLLLAGDEARSRLALAVAQAMLKGQPEEQVFIRALVRRDLELALYSLKLKSEPELGTDESL